MKENNSGISHITLLILSRQKIGVEMENHNNEDQCFRIDRTSGFFLN